MSTSAYGALEVLHIVRYINLLTYLLTSVICLVEKVEKQIFLDELLQC